MESNAKVLHYRNNITHHQKAYKGVYPIKGKMVEETKNEGTERIIHFSVGSAATNTHLSTDVSLDDPTIESTFTRVLELWEKTRIAREKYDIRRK